MRPSVRGFIERYDSNSPLAQASTPPAAWYTDPRILEVEQRTVLSCSWQLTGRSDQVRNPGQYIAADVAGEAILVV
jgi:choline monooxygenase